MRFSLLLFIWVVFFTSHMIAQEERYALLIGNEAYSAQSGALRQVGLQVTVCTDRTANEIESDVDKLRADLREAVKNEVGFLYYASHGASAEINGVRQNYLMPANTQIADGSQLSLRGIALDRLINGLSSAEAKAVFFVSNACHNTLPWPTERGGEQNRAFGAVAKRSGLFVAYAASDGQTTPDDLFFAEQLAREIKRAGQTADRVFTVAMHSVSHQRTGGKLPFVSDGLLEDVCFSGCSDVSNISGDERDWNHLKALDTRGVYETYLKLHPAGRFVSDARVALSRLPAAFPPQTASRLSAEEARTAITAGKKAYEKKDYTTAGTEWQHACDSGSAQGCTNLGFLFRKGLDVRQDSARAGELYRLACNGGNAPGCANLGHLHQKGFGVVQDYARARELLKRACDGGDALGCKGFEKLIGGNK